MQFRPATVLNRLSSVASTKNVLQVVVLSVQIFQLCVSSETAVIGVLSDVTNPMECEEIIPTNVYEITSLRWLTDVLNQNNYTRGIKLEIDVEDVCPYKSGVLRTIHLINKYKTGPKKLLGILTLTTSANMLNISWFLSSLPANDQIIQIGTTETAYKLNDRSLHPTFFRVIPDDEYQFQLIATLLYRLKWNYIAIIHEQDIYGEEGAEILSQQLPAFGIILAASLGIGNVEDINEQLFILTSDYPNVQGVVIIAQSWSLQRLSEETKKKIDRYRFILTESVLIDDTFSNLKAFKNSIAILRPQISFESVERNWHNQFNQAHVKQNVNFREMIQQHAGCADALHSSCNLTAAAGKLSAVINKNTMLTKFIGLYTFAFLLRERLEQCGSPTCELSALKMNDIQNKKIDFSYLSGILSYPKINLSGQFNKVGNLDFPKGFEAYQVYSNLENKETGRFSFKEVGQYNRNELNLNMSALKTVEMWGVCHKGKNCRVCAEDFPKFLYREGDIMLFGIVPVRISNDAKMCSCLDSLTPSDLAGSQLAEAMLYAVETLNEGKIYEDLFPGKKIGIVIMDSCNQQIPTFESILSFWRGTADICQNTLNCFDITNRTLVYVGALTSEVSIRISQLMFAAKTVQVSYASSSSVFRSPLSLKYPNFLRLTPSNSFQISAMIDICVKMKWLYVSLIYSDDTYGRSAKKELLDKAILSNMCVIQSLPYKKGDGPSYFVERLKRRPEAKVVIILMNSEISGSLMASLVENIEEREFMFLGSESLGQRLVNEKVGEKIIGSLTLSIDIPPNSAFEAYMRQKELDVYKSNAWSLAAMESQCYKNMSLNKISSTLCPESFTLSKLKGQTPWAPMVIQSIYAAAVGLNMSIREFCKKVEVCPKLFRKIEDVVDIFKSVKLKDPDGQYKRVFDNNGDGTSSYIIYQVQEKDKTYVYTEIGSWSQTTGLILDTSLIDVPPLDCPNYKRCSECPVTSSKETPPKNYIGTLIAFVCLLVLSVMLIALFWFRTRTDQRPPTPDDDKNVNNLEDLNSERESEGSVYASIAEATGSNGEETIPKIMFSNEDSMNIPEEFLNASLAMNPAYEGFNPNQGKTFWNNLEKRDNCSSNVSSESNASDVEDTGSYLEPTGVKRSDSQRIDGASSDGYNSDTSVKKTWDMSPGAINPAYEKNEL